MTTCQARPPAPRSRGNRPNQNQSSSQNSKFNTKKTLGSPHRKINNFISDPNSQLQCPHFAECSGCTLDADLTSPPSLHRATSFFQETLGYEEFKLHTGPPQGWRHRARLAVRSSFPDIFGNNLTPCVGLFKSASHIAIDIPKCTVHHPALNVVADLIRLCITMCETETYDETSGKGQLRYIQLALADPPERESILQEEEIVAVQVVLVWNAPDLESSAGLEEFAETLWLQGAAKLALAMATKVKATTSSSPLVALHSIHANFQPLKSNAILGPNTVLLHGSSESWTHITLPLTPSSSTDTSSSAPSTSSLPPSPEKAQDLLTVPISFDPNSFMQANPSTMTLALQSMRSWITPGSNIVDLHAGVGTIGLVLAASIENIASLRAVEINPSAEASFWKSWKRLKKEEQDRKSEKTADGGAETSERGGAAFLFSLPEKVEYFVAAAGSDPERWVQGADVVILDPPRKGLEPELLDYFCSLNNTTLQVGSDDAGSDGEESPAVAVSQLQPSTVKRLLYLSCGFSAFERDCLKLLESGAWKLVSTEGFLFFPGADHIETLAVFDRKIE